MILLHLPAVGNRAAKAVKVNDVMCPVDLRTLGIGGETDDFKVTYCYVDEHNAHFGTKILDKTNCRFELFPAEPFKAPNGLPNPSQKADVEVVKAEPFKKPIVPFSKK